MGLFDDFEDAVSDVGDAVGSVVEVGVDAAGDTLGGAASVVSDAGGLVVDATGAAIEAGASVVEAVFDTAAGPTWALFDATADVVIQVATPAADILLSGVEVLADAATEVTAEGWNLLSAAADAGGSATGIALEGLATGVGEAGGLFADGTVVASQVIDDATFGGASDLLNTADEYLFDEVDYLTHGIIDLDYDDGTFSADLGVPGLVGANWSVGSDGVSYGFELPTVSAGFEFGRHGLQVGGSVGIDFELLPYAEGHVELGDDGRVEVAGRAQGTIPLPNGTLVGGKIGSGFERNADGSWAVNGSLDGQYTLASGTYVGAGIGGRYSETADGDSDLSLTTSARLGQYGVGEVSVTGGYDRSDHDGVVVERTSVGAEASGYGAHAEVTVTQRDISSADGSISETEVSGSVEGYGARASAEYGRTVGTWKGERIDDERLDASLDIDAAAVASSAQTIASQLGVETPLDDLDLPALSSEIPDVGAIAGADSLAELAAAAGLPSLDDPLSLIHDGNVVGQVQSLGTTIPIDTAGVSASLDDASTMLGIASPVGQLDHRVSDIVSAPIVALESEADHLVTTIHDEFTEQISVVEQLEDSVDELFEGLED